MSSVIIVTLLVFFVVTNAYWYYFTGEILDDWKASTDKWAEINRRIDRRFEECNVGDKSNERPERSKHMSEVKGGYYRHFKGNIYFVIAVGVHTETGEKFVVYREASRDINAQIWIRPLDMFTDTVGGKPRFERI